MKIRHARRPRTSRVVWFAVALTAISQPARVKAGPPLITDDPDTPGDGHWEVNAAVTVERRVAERTVEAPLLDINYGLGDRLQVQLLTRGIA